MNVETPCIVIDYDVMCNNIERFSQMAKQNNCKLRPHVKTHKIPEIAQMQIEAGAQGITVAKISEAEIMAHGGIDDIFIAYPIIGDRKTKRILELDANIRLIVGIDSMEGAKALSMAAQSENRLIEARVEVDTGLKRTGVPYEEVESFMNQISKLDGIAVKGIYTFRGLIYKGEKTQDRQKAGMEEGTLMVELANRLKKEGHCIQDISVGSTPTAEFAAQVSGINEVRPGTYVFNDAMQINMSVCKEEECAAMVWATVVSRPTENIVVIDGGSKAFSTDTPLGVFPHYLKGYGKIINYDDLIFDRMSEEHGIITVPNGAEAPEIGECICVIPNHICTTVNLHNKLYIARKGKIEREVTVSARGMVY